MPLDQFVDIYVRLRHPHHYDPSSWPPWLWLSFLFPLTLAAALWMWRTRQNRLTDTWREADDWPLPGAPVAPGRRADPGRGEFTR